MTPQEAIKWMETFKEHYFLKEAEEACNLAIQALKEQIKGEETND